MWKADLYREEALRQLSDTSFYTKLNCDFTPTHQKTLKTTINDLVKAGELLTSASNLIINTPRMPILCFFT